MIKYRFQTVEGKTKKRLTRLETVVKKTITLKELAKQLSKRTGIPVADTIVLVDELKNELANCLLNSCNVQFDGIGVFSVELQRNERLEVIPHKVRFLPSEYLRKTINKAELKEV